MLRDACFPISSTKDALKGKSLFRRTPTRTGHILPLSMPSICFWIRQKLELSLLLLVLFAGFCVQSTYAESEWITKRFGENTTCDVKGVTSDTSLSVNSKDTNYGTQAYLHGDAGSLEIMIMRFDLSSHIAKGTPIKKAVLRLFDNYNSPGYFTLPVFRITDPNGSGMWDASKATYNMKNKDSSTKWSNSGAGDIFSALDTNKISDLFKYSWINAPLYGPGTAPAENTVHEIDLTAETSAWVNLPEKNLGFMISLDPTRHGGTPDVVNRIYSSEAPSSTSNGLAFFRPYLEITYLSPTGQYETIPQASSVSAKYHSGETFITWREPTTSHDETSFRIYRSVTSPISNLDSPDVTLIDEVWRGSSFLILQNFFPDQPKDGDIVQPNLSKVGIQLDENTGLYVLPIEEKTSTHGYYAVTTVVDGNENRKISGNTADVSGEYSDIPDAFPTRINHPLEGVPHVMYIGRHNHLDFNDKYGFSNLRSMPFAFLVKLPDRAFANGKVSKIEEEQLISGDTLGGQPVKYPVTICVQDDHGGAIDPYFGFYGTNSADQPTTINSVDYENDTWDFGGFMLRFVVSSYNRRIIKTSVSKSSMGLHLLDLGPYIANWPGAHDGGGWYTGYDSAYLPNVIAYFTGDIDTANWGGAYNNNDTTKNNIANTTYMYRFSPKYIDYVPKDQIKSVPYFEKSVVLANYWMKYKSPWTNNIDLNKQYINGQAVGHGLPVALWMHYPKLFSAVYLKNPVLRQFFLNNEFTFGYIANVFGPPGDNRKMPAIGSAVSSLSGDPLNSELTSSGDMTIDDYYDPLKLLQNNPARDYPPAMLYGAVDAFHSIAAANKMNVSAYWGNISTFSEVASEFLLVSDPTARKYAWNLQDFKLNQSILAFTDFKINGLNGNSSTSEPSGGINRYLSYVSRNVDGSSAITDESKNYAVNIYVNSNAPAANEYRTDITLRRLQKLLHSKGVTYNWTNKQNGNVIQTGQVVADQYGLITIPAFQAFKAAGSTLELTSSGTAPVIRLVASPAGSSFTGTTTLSLSATAIPTTGRTISKVEFYDRTTLIATDQSGADGWTTQATLSREGVHNLFAIAYDNRSIGAETGTSSTIYISITGAKPSAPSHLRISN